MASSIILSTNITSLAAERTNAVIEREDVSTEEALEDSSFNPIESEKSKQNITPRTASWNVWGEKSEGEWVGLDLCYKPIGDSEHSLDGGILSTYHYTRTYVEVLFTKRGDSGRVWGNYTVKATGTNVVDSVWLAGTQKVKYGTES